LRDEIKLLVFSDSHGDAGAMIRAAQERAGTLNYIIHLGDILRDAETLTFEFPRIPVLAVPGNNDWAPSMPHERVLELCGHKIYLTHGHRQRVHYGTSLLAARAQALGADLVLYGHTHRYSEEVIGGALFVNPGSVTRPRGGRRGTYAVVTLGESVNVEKGEI